MIVIEDIFVSVLFEAVFTDFIAFWILEIDDQPESSINALDFD